MEKETEKPIDIGKLAEDSYPYWKGYWPEENNRIDLRREGFIKGYLKGEKALKSERDRLEKAFRELVAKTYPDTDYLNNQYTRIILLTKAGLKQEGEG